MTDKVQKIREEVVRLQNELIQEKKKGFGSDADDACILELQNVLTYIDSLQEEPSKFDVAIQEDDDVRYNEDLGCRVNLSQLKRVAKKEEPVSIWHDANQQPTMFRKYLVRYSDGGVSGSWERHDDGFIPWKDVVKEHGFTHWCYVEDLLKI